ncbi:MAG: hypothetical protein M3044_10635 [Thermoproteota archaeon]|nr:hypothetical protein [Thermoproteota archaeon]
MGATNDDIGGGHHPTEKDIVEKDSIKVVPVISTYFCVFVTYGDGTAHTTLDIQAENHFKIISRVITS